MAASPQTVRDIAPELATEPEARLQTFLDFAALSINSSVWGAKADFAQALLAAHYLTMANRGGAGGALTSEKVGDLSRSYGQLEGAELYGATAYGMQYVQLRKTLVITPMVTGCD